MQSGSMAIAEMDKMASRGHVRVMQRFMNLGLATKLPGLDGYFTV